MFELELLIIFLQCKYTYFFLKTTFLGQSLHYVALMCDFFVLWGQVVKTLIETKSLIPGATEFDERTLPPRHSERSVGISKWHEIATSDDVLLAMTDKRDKRPRRPKRPKRSRYQQKGPSHPYCPFGPYGPYRPFGPHHPFGLFGPYRQVKKFNQNPCTARLYSFCRLSATSITLARVLAKSLYFITSRLGKSSGYSPTSCCISVLASSSVRQSPTETLK